MRSASFAIYRITPRTSAEIFIAIGMSIALESQYGYKIPKVFLANASVDVPSLLSEYQVITAKNDKERSDRLWRYLPEVVHRIRGSSWNPRPLPFVDTTVVAGAIEPIELKSERRPHHVLIVDDDAQVRQRLVDLFQMSGYQTTDADTNAQALDLLDNSDLPFSLVSTDALRRPERAGEAGYVGLDLVREINQRFPELPVILVSRDDPAFLQERAPDLRVQGMLQKGLSDEETITAIQRILAGETLPNPWQTQPVQAYAKILDRLLTLENTLADLVDRALRSEYGSEWPQELNIGQSPDSLSLEALLRLVEAERETFEPVLTLRQAYKTLTKNAGKLIEVRNSLSHGPALLDSAEVVDLQQMVEQLMRAIEDAHHRVGNAAPGRRTAAQYDEEGLSPEESLLLSIFGEFRRARTPLSADKHKELVEEIEVSLRILPPREVRIIRLRFGLVNGRRYTLAEVAQKFGLTSDQVRSIETGALAKLRNSTSADQLQGFVDRLLAESGSAMRDALEEADRLKQAAIESEAAGEWLQAASMWKELRRPIRQAQALESYARSLKTSDYKPDEIASAWAEAAQIYESQGNIDKASDCQREVARHLRQPVITLDVEIDRGLVLDAWSRLQFIVRNEGHGPARMIFVRVSGGQFEGQTMNTQEIFTLREGEERMRWLDVCPRAYGDSVPLRVQIEYQDHAGEPRQCEHTVHIPVAREEDEVAPPPASSWNTAAIRNLLTAAFSDEELTTLCFDHFRPVYEDFSTRMSKGQNIQRLLEYCIRHDRVVELVAHIKRQNPAQFDRFSGQLRYDSPSANQRTLVATFSIVINDVLASGKLPLDAPTTYLSLCDWLEEDLRDRLQARLSDFQYTEASKRDGETLSVRVAFPWDREDERSVFSDLEWWKLQELLPFEDVYPDRDEARLWNERS